jgi:hypothetical protein
LHEFFDAFLGKVGKSGKGRKGADGEVIACGCSKHKFVEGINVYHLTAIMGKIMK